MPTIKPKRFTNLFPEQALIPESKVGAELGAEALEQGVKRTGRGALAVDPALIKADMSGAKQLGHIGSVAAIPQRYAFSKLGELLGIKGTGKPEDEVEKQYHPEGYVRGADFFKGAGRPFALGPESTKEKTAQGVEEAMGLAAEMAGDPLNLVGPGMVDDAARVARAVKGAKKAVPKSVRNIPGMKNIERETFKVGNYDLRTSDPVLAKKRSQLLQDQGVVRPGSMMYKEGGVKGVDLTPEAPPKISPSAAEDEGLSLEEMFEQVRKKYENK